MEVVEVIECPVVHSEIMNPELRDNTTQQILDDPRPDGILMALWELQADLESKYQLMREHNPAQARIQIARHMRSAIRGAYGAVLNGQMVQELSERKGAEREKFIWDASRARYEYHNIWLNATYHGTAEYWMQAMGVIDSDAQWNLHGRNSPGARALRGIEAILPISHRQLSDAYYLAGDTNRSDYWGISTSGRQGGLNMESLSTTLDLILAGYIAITKSGEMNAKDADAVADTLLQNIEPLSRIASVNSNVMKELLPSANGHNPPGSVYDPDGSDLPRLENAFRYEGGILIPNHPSIEESEWRVRAKCGGMGWFALPDPVTTVHVEAYFDEIGLRGKGVDAEGRTQAVQNILANGIEVARRTVLMAEDSPVIGRYVLAA